MKTATLRRLTPTAKVPHGLLRVALPTAIAALSLLIAFGSGVASAADAEFVGVLAIALEKEAGEQLQLTPEQKAGLLKIVERRESEVLELALQLRNATPDELQAKLAPFRQASEAEGLKLLNEAQRATLEQLRIRRAAASSLAEPALAAKLQLTPEQATAVAKLSAERREQLGRVNGQEREVLRNTFEQRLFALLTPEQKTVWDRAAGISTPTVAIVERAQAQAAPNTTPVAKPAATGGAVGAAAPAGEKVAAGSKENVKLRFNFRFQPWGEVLDWFAQQADLSLVMDAPPPGTLNYTDSREYTPAEALDLMNGVLLTKGFTLVRRQRMLMVVNLEDGIPPNLVPFVTAEKLDTLGEFELATTLFRLERLSAEDADAEIRRLIGPQGAVVMLPRAGQVQVTETAGRLRLIRSVLQASANMIAGNTTGDVRSFQPVHVGVEDVLPLMRQLLDIPADGYAAADGSLRLAVDPLTGKLLVGGKPERVAQVAEIIKAIDVPAPVGNAATAIETPQLEVYDVGVSDPNSVLQILQTLLSSYSDVKLTTDPQTGKLVALARPTQHATIRAVIEQMQREARQVEVLRLQFVDPQAAISAINRLFGGAGEAAGPGAPKVEADPLARQLIVRGSPAQIEQIRGLLVKMGEQATDGSPRTTERANVRMLPLGTRSVRTALEQLEAVWPTMRANKIRVVSPSSTIRSNYPAGTVVPPTSDDLEPAPEAPVVPAKPQAAPAAEGQPKAPADKAAALGFRVRNVVLSRTLDEQAPAQSTPTQSKPTEAAPTTNTPATAAPAAAAAPVAPAKEPAAIVVALGPNGVMIASDDLDALDQFESLLTSLANRAATGGKEFTVFYLQNAGAAAAAETLESVFGAGGGGGGGGSLIGDIAGMALGNTGGNLVGAMMGGGAPGGTSSITASSSVMIVPDARLNALIVQATPADLDLIEQLLKVVDQLDVPESTVNPRPRLIPIRNTGATQIADILREVYSERMAGANRQRQPSPEEFMQMLRGGGGRGGAQSAGRRGAAETQKISIGIDTRTNSLIVSAPQALYEEIEQLVQTLDHATSESNTAIRIVTLKRSNPEMVQKALSAIVGEKATTTNKPAGSTSSAGNNNGNGGDGNNQQRQGGGNDPMQEVMRQRMEMFNNMRGGFGGGQGNNGGTGSFGGGNRGGGQSRGGSRGR